MNTFGKEQEKNRALYDYKEIHYYQGYHAGKWTDNNQMDSSADEYLEKMKEFADEWKVEYDPNLSHYITDNQYEAECYTKDKMGYEIFLIVTKKLLDIING